MIRALLWLILLATIAVALALLSRYHTGYAILVVGGKRIDLDFNFLLLLVVLGYVVFHLLLRAVAHIRAIPERVRRARAARTDAAQEAAFENTLCAHLEGRHGEVSRLAEAAAAKPDRQRLAAALAALSAEALGDRDARDRWLSRAGDASGGPATLVPLLRASFALADGAAQAARAPLAAVLDARPDHPRGLALKYTLDQAEGNWSAAESTAKALARHGHWDARRLTEAERATALARLDAEATPAAVFAFWRKLGTLRDDSAIAQRAIDRLLAMGGKSQARELIETLLGRAWDPDLVLRYPETAGDDLTPMLARAEQWLTREPRDPALLLTLGRLCAMRDLRGKARGYLEAASSLSQGAEMTGWIEEALAGLGPAR
jgi:HemY protein